MFYKLLFTALWFTKHFPSQIDASLNVIHYISVDRRSVGSHHQNTEHRQKHQILWIHLQMHFWCRICRIYHLEFLIFFIFYFRNKMPGKTKIPTEICSTKWRVRANIQNENGITFAHSMISAHFVQLSSTNFPLNATLWQTQTNDGNIIIIIERLVILIIICFAVREFVVPWNWSTMKAPCVLVADDWWMGRR